MASKASKTSRRYGIEKASLHREWFDRVRRGVRTIEELSALVNDGTPIPNHYSTPDRQSFLTHREINTLNQMSPSEFTTLQPLLENWSKIVEAEGAPSVTDIAEDWSLHDLVAAYLASRGVTDAARQLAHKHRTHPIA